jgi:uncharacterized glyoxalase superfamily protein PhnB
MSIHPTLRYADARAATDFLTTVLGFRAGELTTAADGTVQHAELSFGSPPGVVMIGQRAAEASPWDTGRAVVYLVVDDPDDRHAAAVAAGAEVVMGLTDQPYGSREFAVADPEGNVWTLGTYRPRPR